MNHRNILLGSGLDTIIEDSEDNMTDVQDDITNVQNDITNVQNDITNVQENLIKLEDPLNGFDFVDVPEVTNTQDIILNIKEVKDLYNNGIITKEQMDDLIKRILN